MGSDGLSGVVQDPVASARTNRRPGGDTGFTPPASRNVSTELLARITRNYHLLSREPVRQCESLHPRGRDRWWASGREAGSSLLDGGRGSISVFHGRTSQVPFPSCDARRYGRKPTVRDPPPQGQTPAPLAAPPLAPPPSQMNWTSLPSHPTWFQSPMVACVVEIDV